MKLLHGLAMVLVLAVLAFATSYTNQKYDSIAVGDDTLTLTAVSGTFSLPSGATVLVYNANGSLATPQPSLAITPNIGGPAGTTMVIKCEAPDVFPSGGKVVISQIDTSGSDPKPTGDFSST